jgi:hypothetical protein
LRLPFAIELAPWRRKVGAGTECEPAATLHATVQKAGDDFENAYNRTDVV